MIYNLLHSDLKAFSIITVMLQLYICNCWSKQGQICNFVYSELINSHKEIAINYLKEENILSLLGIICLVATATR